MSCLCILLVSSNVSSQNFNLLSFQTFIILISSDSKLKSFQPLVVSILPFIYSDIWISCHSNTFVITNFCHSNVLPFLSFVIHIIYHSKFMSFKYVILSSFYSNLPPFYSFIISTFSHSNLLPFQSSFILISCYSKFMSLLFVILDSPSFF